MTDQTTRRAGPAVLYLGFNRPHLTAVTFDSIRRAAPQRLFVALDGPRGKPGEVESCNEVAKIVGAVDWDCEVHRLVRTENLGCRRAVSSAIDWFFDLVDEGVVVEDDCLLSGSFLGYCADLLEKYRNDERVWMISGTNLLGQWRYRRASYFFGEGGVWGWATWRRAWHHADIDLRSWADPESRTRAEAFFGRLQWRLLKPLFQATAEGRIDTWDYGWSFTRASHGALAAIPAINLVRNLGFGADATHTSESSPFAQLPCGDLAFPLRHPDSVTFDRGYQRRQLLTQARSGIERRLHLRGSAPR